MKNPSSRQKAEDVMLQVVIPRIEQLQEDNPETDLTITSNVTTSFLHRKNGLQINTSRGIIDVLGTGEIVDYFNILEY